MKHGLDGTYAFCVNQFMCTLINRQHHTHAVHRCGLLLQMSHVAWSVCVCWSHWWSWTVKQEAQLPKRDRAMSYVTEFVLCFTSYGSYKSFKQQKWPSRSLAMVPFNRPHMTSYSSSIAAMSLSCTVSKILSLISQNLKRPSDSEHIPFDSNISCTHTYSSVSISTWNLNA